MRRHLVSVLAVMALATSASADKKKIKAARCTEPCLFLVDNAIDKAPTAFRAACGAAAKTTAPDYKSCTKLEYNLACIAAAHGFVSPSKHSKVFESKPWYVRNASFKPKALSAIEKANRKVLDARADECSKPADADVALAKKWLAGLSKLSTVPADTYVLESDEPRREPKADAAQLKAYLFSATDASNNKLDVAPRFAAPANFFLPEYADPDMPYEDTPAIVTTSLARPGIRVLMARFTADFGSDHKLIVDGSRAHTASVFTDIYFVFDAKNDLVALHAVHHVQ